MFVGLTESSAKGPRLGSRGKSLKFGLGGEVREGLRIVRWIKGLARYL